MSGSIWKGGWHPEGKGGKKESWRGDFKGINQIAGKFGKGKEASASEERENHVSQPLTSLKDREFLLLSRCLQPSSENIVLTREQRRCLPLRPSTSTTTAQRLCLMRRRRIHEDGAHRCRRRRFNNSSISPTASKQQQQQKRRRSHRQAHTAKIRPVYRQPTCPNRQSAE